MHLETLHSGLPVVTKTIMKKYFYFLYLRLSTCVHAHTKETSQCSAGDIFFVIKLVHEVACTIERDLRFQEA